MSTTIMGRKALLLVEDDANDVLLFRRAFARLALNLPLHVSEDGDKAINYLSGRPPWNDRDLFPLPSLVLLDLKLPRKSGFEVLAWIRMQENLRRLPVVVFTSSRENRDVCLAYDLGANSYLVKPAGYEALAETLKSVWNYWLLLNESPGLGLPELRARALGEQMHLPGN
jgi:CheY-like chemotaxis protein